MIMWIGLVHISEINRCCKRWRTWIRECLSYDSFAVLGNRSAKVWVKATK